MTICKIKGDCRTAFRACMKPINKHRSPLKVGVAVRNVDMILRSCHTKFASTVTSTLGTGYNRDRVSASYDTFMEPVKKLTFCRS